MSADAPMLFEFSQAGAVWRYTSRGETITAIGYDWEPAPIQLASDITQSNEINQHALKIDIARNHDFAAMLLAGVGEAPLFVTVRRWDGAAWLVEWKGRVASPSAGKTSLSINCEDVFTSQRRIGLRALYQVSCRHNHYGRGCGLARADFGLPMAVSAVAGAVLTVPDAAGYADGWFVGGIVAFGDAERAVMAHVGDQITVLRPFDDTLAYAVANSGYGINYGGFYGGAGVTLYPGCDRSIATCETRFANRANHGGFAAIPTHNPFGGSSIV